MTRSLIHGLLIFAALVWLPASSAQEESRMYYVGTYTNKGSQGVYRIRLDLRTGELTPLGEPAAAVNPSFVAVHPSGNYLYAVSEIGDFDGRKSGAVAAYRIGEQGELSELNRRPSGGAAPCHLIVDRTGKYVLVANYTGGSVAVLPIAEDGRLGEMTSLQQHEGSSVNPQRQQGPHAHSINLDSANRFAYAADLGLDRVLIYAFDEERGTLTPAGDVRVAAGAGPRHFSLHPSRPWAYAINELNSTITSFRVGNDGSLQVMESVSTVPAGFQGVNYTAEVLVHPSGKFVYGSNRGHDSLAAFAVDAESGKLQLAGVYATGGRTPRNFRIDPSGKYLLAANQESDSIEVFEVDLETGELRATGHRLAIPSPVCLREYR